MKVRVQFALENQAQFMNTPTVFLDRTYSYLLVRRGQNYNHYLRLHNGVIEVVRFHHEDGFLESLRPHNKCSLKHAARIYMNSTLPKTDQALEALKQILSSDNDDRVNFLTGPNPRLKGEEPLERVSKADRLKKKANTVSLEQICKSLDIAPSVVRAAFRRHKVKKPGSRWQWPKSQRDSIENFIKSMG